VLRGSLLSNLEPLFCAEQGWLQCAVRRFNPEV